jgi:methyl halide transferase
MTSWEEHWAESNTPWDQGKPAPPLVRLMSELTQSPEFVRGAKALVPGCGAGYDAFCLARSGYEAVGLDIAPSVRPRFDAARDAFELEAGKSPGEVTLITGDFFSASLEALGGPYDFIWDYTFYCAIDVEMRKAWANRMFELLKPEGTLATLLFPVDRARPLTEGPPFALDPEEVTASLSNQWERVRLEQVTDSHPKRENKEWLALWKPRKH